MLKSRFLKTALFLASLSVFFFLLLNRPYAAEVCSGSREVCATCEDDNCQVVGESCGYRSGTCYAMECNEYGECWGPGYSYPCEYWSCNYQWKCDTYSCPPCIQEETTYSCPGGQTCGGNGGCVPEPTSTPSTSDATGSLTSDSTSNTDGASGGTQPSSEVSITPTPSPIPCENPSVCPSEYPVVRCSGSQCQSGVSCWCASTQDPGTGAGNCTSSANCSGTAPCPIGLEGAWYCNSGQCQSSCQSPDSNTAPPPDTQSQSVSGPTPTPPPGCTPSSPANPVLSAPQDNQTLGNTSVTFTWEGVSSWGENCTLGTAGYKVFADQNANPGTEVCSVDASTTSCSVDLNDQTAYNWKVVANNGVNQSSSPIWSFTVKQPVVSGTLFEDVDANGCYNSSSSEQPVATPNTITVLANGQGSYCSRTNSTYACTVPGSNTPGQSTVVNLSSSGYTPPYTAQTNCATGENGSCSVNNCSLTLSAGGTASVNIGYTTKQWFQTNSCSVYSQSNIQSVIPPNAQDFDTGAAVAKYFVLNNPGTVITGSSTALDFGQSGGTSSQPNWQEKNYSLPIIQNYGFFKQKLARRADTITSGGTLTLAGGKITDAQGQNYTITNNSVWEITGNLDIQDSLSLSGINSTVLVSGNITISGNFTPSNSNFAFINQGNVAVLSTVSEIRGLFLTDGTFSSGESVNLGLKVVGSVVAGNGFSLGRKWQNLKPAEYFVCDPSAFINLVPVLGLSSHTWAEIAP